MPPKTVLVPFACAIALSLLLVSCQPRSVQEEARIRPVKTQVVSNAARDIVRRFAGGAQTAISSRLSFRVSGVLSTLDVQVGQVMNKGDLLASLNFEDAGAKLNADKSALANAKAQEKSQASQFVRIKNLFDRNMVSRAEYDLAEASLKAAQNTIEQANTAFELSKKQVEYSYLKSPMDECTVSQLHIHENETVSAGQHIATLNCGSSIEVIVAVPESVIRNINHGNEVDVVFPSVRNRIFRGRVSEIGNAANQNSAYPVTVAIESGENLLRPGMAAEVAFKFQSDKATGAYWVPLSSLGNDGDSAFVYLFGAQTNGLGKVVKQAVEVGIFTLEEVEIKAGLKAGDKVIIAGRSQIYEGLEVKLMSELP